MDVPLRNELYPIASTADPLSSSSSAVIKFYQPTDTVDRTIPIPIYRDRQTSSRVIVCPPPPPWHIVASPVVNFLDLRAFISVTTILEPLFPRG